MIEEPDLVDVEKITDVTAYILRRDWATRACNICRLRPDQVDYLMGHSIQKDKKRLSDPETRLLIAWALERYVLILIIQTIQLLFNYSFSGNETVL